jgi:hypothetical protein
MYFCKNVFLLLSIDTLIDNNDGRTYRTYDIQYFNPDKQTYNQSPYDESTIDTLIRQRYWDHFAVKE